MARRRCASLSHALDRVVIRVRSRGSRDPRRDHAVAVIPCIRGGGRAGRARDVPIEVISVCRRAGAIEIRCRRVRIGVTRFVLSEIVTECRRRTAEPAVGGKSPEVSALSWSFDSPVFRVQAQVVHMLLPHANIEHDGWAPNTPKPAAALVGMRT